MAFDLWKLTNYRWSEAFIWIAAVASLIFGLFLFASYLNSRKKNLLLWAYAFLGTFVFSFEMIDFFTSDTDRRTGITTITSGPGTYAMLGGAFETSMFGIFVAMLLVLIPGFIAAGLALNKDKKFGKIYTYYVVILSVLYMFLRMEPNTAILPTGTSTIIATVLVLAVQLPSGLLIIALPLMGEGPLVPKTMLAAGGGIALTHNILMWLVMLMQTLGTPLGLEEGGTTDIFLMIYPFFFLIAIVCLIYGLIGNKDYGFTIGNVVFED